MKNQDLIGRRYVDEKDSGDLVMEVVAIDGFFPDEHVIVRPVGYDRIWWRGADIVREIVEQYERTTSDD